LCAIQSTAGGVGNRRAQRRERNVQRLHTGDEDEVMAAQPGEQRGHGGTEPAAEQVAAYRRAQTDQREADAGNVEPIAGELDAHTVGRGTQPSGPDRGKATSPTQAMSRDHRGGAGVRRLRPLRRRALRTWRPPGVDMRMRNPCVLRRYFFLGW
jgi:hypothetical protein